MVCDRPWYKSLIVRTGCLKGRADYALRQLTTNYDSFATVIVVVSYDHEHDDTISRMRFFLIVSSQPTIIVCRQVFDHVQKPTTELSTTKLL